MKTEAGDFLSLGRDALRLLKHLVSETNHTFDKEVPIKVHFGEKGNKTFVPPVCYDEIIRYLKDMGVTTSYIESNVLYRVQELQEQNILRRLKNMVLHRFR